MSAYFVPKATIDALVSYAIQQSIYARVDPCDSVSPVRDGTASAFGRMLWAANADSIVARYSPDKDERDSMYESAEGYTFAAINDVSPACAFGCAQNLDYQSCESDEWLASPAWVFLHQIIDHSASVLIRNAGIDTPWGIQSAAEAKKYRKGKVPA